MDTKLAFGKALKKIRKSRGLTQEDFSDISSRTYMSTLERGIKSITLDKLEDIAGVMDIHPMTLLLLTFSIKKESVNYKELLSLLENEIKKFQ